MNINPMETQRQSDNTKVLELKQMVMETLALPHEVTIMVTELQCRKPGCPLLETVIAILAGSGKNRQYKIHKPLCEVRREDLLRAVAMAETVAITQEKHT